MSTMLLTAPLARPRRSAVPRMAPPRSVAAPARALPAPRCRQRSAVRAAPGARTTLRLTRRGRLVVFALLLTLALAASLFTGAISVAGTTRSAVPVRYVTVEPGQTLWAIAGEVAPGADRRDTVSQILELNALPGSGVQAGQRIAVPITR